jgi:hypothetical protein
MHLYSELVSSLKGLDQRFFELLAWANYGAYSQSWLRSFRHLGILHLLVLSGSQMQLLFRGQKTGFLILSSPKSLRFLRFFLWPWLAWGTHRYLSLNDYSPPLLRAFLCLWLVELARRLAWPETAMLFVALLLQLWIFPEHAAELSFYLSWICYVALLIFSSLKLGRVLEILSLSIFAQLLIELLGLSETRGFWDLGRVLLANLVFAYLFETYLSFLLSVLLAASLYASFLPASVERNAIHVLKTLITPPMEGIMLLIDLASGLLSNI